MRINLIVAMAKNRVIGVDNQMPWHLPADFAWFKKHTTGFPVVMGRNTFESIGKPLPNRRNIVVTRNADWHTEGCETARSLSAAITLAGDTHPSELFIIGGAMLYRAALHEADRLFITEVDATLTGDTHFPEFQNSEWRETFREHRAQDEKNRYAMDFVILVRQNTRQMKP